MVRYFDRERGRAIAFASLGFTAGEAILPVIAVFTLALIGWRWTYGAAAVLIGLTVIPTVIWLLKHHDTVHSRSRKLSRTVTPTSQLAVRSWTRREVIRDYFFYLLMPGLLAVSMISTALFFHHLNLADEKSWSHTWITSNYSVYAATTCATLIYSGTLIDRLSAIRIMPYLLTPLVLAMITVGLIDSAWGVVPYMLLMGIPAQYKTVDQPTCPGQQGRTANRADHVDHTPQGVAEPELELNMRADNADKVGLSETRIQCCHETEAEQSSVGTEQFSVGV